MTEYKVPVKTLTDISDDEIGTVLCHLEEQGYMIVQKKRHQKSEGVVWDLKAKLSSPPEKIGRVLTE